jgi:hypothetical protein
MTIHFKSLSSSQESEPPVQLPKTRRSKIKPLNFFAYIVLEFFSAMFTTPHNEDRDMLIDGKRMN